ncbi:MAG: hypothetical protein ACI4JG_07930 [Acutalibacteraceae bacterium]
MKGVWKGENDELGLLNGKTYDIVSEEFDGKMFSVVDETGGEYLYPSDDFELVSQETS